jgi:hypothetical protein
MGPLPRYLLARCCGNPGHLTNRNGDNYIDEMIQAIRDVYSWINNTIFMRRIKGVKIFNPTHALGFNDYDVNIDTIIDLWGDDPVHPTPAAYKVLADKLASMVDDMLAEPTSVPASPTPTKKRAAPREPWIISSEPVAKRLIPALSSQGASTAPVAEAAAATAVAAVAAEEASTAAGEATGVWPAVGEATSAALASRPTTTKAVANMPTAPAAAAGPGAGAATSRQSEVKKKITILANICNNKFYHDLVF